MASCRRRVNGRWPNCRRPGVHGETFEQKGEQRRAHEGVDTQGRVAQFFATEVTLIPDYGGGHTFAARDRSPPEKPALVRALCCRQLVPLPPDLPELEA